MKKMRQLLVCLFVSVLLLSACGVNPVVEESLPPETASPTESVPETTESTPETTAVIKTGTLQTTPLDEVEADLSRCNQTSGGFFWERDAGFYHVFGNKLYYADKTDLTLWIPVCSKPDCLHRDGDQSCGAYVPAEIMIIGDRIYQNEIYSPTGEVITMISTALDGTDRRTEFVLHEADELVTGGSFGKRLVMTPNYLAAFIWAMNTEGTYDIQVYTVDHNGVVIQKTGSHDIMSGAMWPAAIGGGEWFESYTIDYLDGNEGRQMLYSLQNGELVSVDITGLPANGAYFDGKEMWYFEPNDGYYHVDVTTGEKTMLSKPKMENSGATVALPNCIVESSLMGRDSQDYETERQEMWLFDGEQWLSVALPEEIQNIASNRYFGDTIAVASDRILLRLMTEKNYVTEELYQILLNTDTPTLEYLGTIG